MSLESVERVLSGTACPALRGLLGKQVTAISAPQWLPEVPEFTSLHEVHLGEMPGESLPQVLELPKLKVLNVSKVAGSVPDGLQAPNLEILYPPWELLFSYFCLCKPQGDIKHTCFVKVLGGVEDPDGAGEAHLIPGLPQPAEAPHPKLGSPVVHPFSLFGFRV